MAKLHIYYNLSRNKTNMGKLKVKIDDKNEIEIEEYQKQSVELESGIHNIKMYVPWLGGYFGYVDENIEIENDDVFYYYKPPFTHSQKGKFVKLAGYEALEKLTKRNKIISMVSLIVVVAIIVLWIIKVRK